MIIVASLAAYAFENTRWLVALTFIVTIALLPLVHSRATIDDVFVSRPPAERRRFHDERWNNWRWRLLLKAFFSRFTFSSRPRFHSPSMLSRW